MRSRFATCLAFFLLDHFFAKFAVGGEGPAVNDAKAFFLFMIWQMKILSVCVPLKFSIGSYLCVARRVKGAAGMRL